MAKKTTVKKRTAPAARKPAAARKKATKRPAAKKPARTKSAVRTKPASRSKSAPALPNGWVELDVFEPKLSANAEPPVEQQLEEFITEEVAGSYFDDKTILKLSTDLYCDLAPKARLKRLAPPMLAAARAAHKREQKTWPKLTDNARLDRAFAELEKQGILARQNFWCCSNCGGVAISDQVERANKRGKKKLRGYTFFHEQDTDMAVFGHGLHLDYGGPHIDDAGSAEIGKLIVKALRKEGLKPKWSGDLDDRIHIPMKWQRKFTKQVRYVPD